MVAQAVGALRVETITTLTGLAAVREEWTELAQSAEGITVFQTWEWVASWYEHFGRRTKPVILAVRSGDGQLVGVVPCSIARVGLLGIRLLFLLGPGHDLTEYLAPIFRPSLAAEAARAIVDTWDRQRDKWDVLVLPLIREDDPLLAAVRSLITCGYTVAPYWQGVGIHRAMPQGWEAFSASLSRGMRKHLRKNSNRLSREGHAVRFRVVTDRRDLEAAIDTFLDLHHRRAHADLRVRHDDLFRPHERRAFLRSVCRRLGERDQLVAGVLEVDGTPVASQLGFTFQRTFYCYYSGFDPAWAWHGVMLILLQRCIAYGIERGCTELDLLLGYDQEKLRWGGEPRRAVSLLLASPRLKSRLVMRALLWLHSVKRRMDGYDWRDRWHSHRFALRNVSSLWTSLTRRGNGNRRPAH
jgi:CelD/BcsL family acetyltransferase involved in cellulose biosynthesis